MHPCETFDGAAAASRMLLEMQTQVTRTRGQNKGSDKAPEQPSIILGFS